MVWARDKFSGPTPNADGGSTQYSPSDYGGIAATYDANGNMKQTGAGAAVERARDLGQGFQNRPDYQFDWSQADQSAKQANASGVAQHDANDVWNSQATGQDHTAMNYGQSLLDKGQQNQQAAALSGAGGPLAQVGAAGRAQNSAAGYQMRGQNELEAQHADDMAAGRAGLSAGLAQERKMGQTGQSLNDQQTEMSAEAAARQRAMRDAGQFAMEGQGNNINQNALDAQNNKDKIGKELGDAKRAHDDADDERTNQIMTTSGGLVGGAVGGPVGAVAGSAVMGGLGKIFGVSDERAKERGESPLVALLKSARNQRGEGDDERDLQGEYLQGQGERPNTEEGDLLQQDIEQRTSSQPKAKMAQDPMAPAGQSSLKPFQTVARAGREGTLESRYAPSDEIAENARLAYGQPQTSPENMGDVFKSHGKDTMMDHDALHAGIEDQLQKDASSGIPKTYQKDDPGVSGVRRGYHATRTSADVTRQSDATSPDTWASDWDAKNGQAPGTRDALKYGTPSARSEKDMDLFSKQVTLSDERAKKKLTETDGERDARETAEFMGQADTTTVKAPQGYEERERVNQERRDAEAAEKKRLADEEQRLKAQYVDMNDQRHVQTHKGTFSGLIPGMKAWEDRKDAEYLARRAARPEAQRAADADGAKAYNDRKKQASKEGEELNQKMRSTPVLGGAMRLAEGAARGVAKAVGYKEPEPKPKEDVAVSDERAKNKASGYEDVQTRDLSTGNGSGLGWDQDDGGSKLGSSRVFKDKAADGSAGKGGGEARLGGDPEGRVNMADAERARAEAIAKRKEAEAVAAPRPRPAQRKYSNSELVKLAHQMQQQTEAQGEILKEGASVSDERAKTRQFFDKALHAQPQMMAAEAAARQIEGVDPKADADANTGAPGKRTPSEAGPQKTRLAVDDYDTHGSKLTKQTRPEDLLHETFAPGPAKPKAPAPDTTIRGARGINPLIEMQREANLKLRGEPYTYKEGVGEDPNQVHHGFMAQHLQENPITATAVRKGPGGLLMVDKDDVARVTASGVASLQEQHDQLEAAVSALASRRGRKAS